MTIGLMLEAGPNELSVKWANRTANVTTIVNSTDLEPKGEL